MLKRRKSQKTTRKTNSSVLIDLPTVYTQKTNNKEILPRNLTANNSPGQLFPPKSLVISGDYGALG
jgi:hypothetical protein